jgi:hypothetical protein
MRNLNKSVSVKFPHVRRSDMNPGPGYYNSNPHAVRSGTPTNNYFNKADITQRSKFLEMGERTPGPAAYNDRLRNRFNSVCYTFYKDPKHDPIGSPLIGPGTYETRSIY